MWATFNILESHFLSHAFQKSSAVTSVEHDRYVKKILGAGLKCFHLHVYFFAYITSCVGCVLLGWLVLLCGWLDNWLRSSVRLSCIPSNSPPASKSKTYDSFDFEWVQTRHCVTENNTIENTLLWTHVTTIRYYTSDGTIDSI